MNQIEFISKKHASGATIVETIKAVMKEYGVSLSEAKTLVSIHPAWGAMVSAAQPLYEDIEDSMRENRPRLD